MAESDFLQSLAIVLVATYVAAVIFTLIAAPFVWAWSYLKHRRLSCSDSSLRSD